MCMLPMKRRRYLAERSIRFEEHEEDGQKAVIVKQFGLPPGRFDAPAADILILLPNSYPDSPPDMFYTLPWLKLTASNRYPNRADVSHEFQGHGWQRWSRHNNEWRVGVDGIWTMLKRVETALECAA